MNTAVAGNAVEHTTREIEEIIEYARELRSDAQNVRSRLYDIRSRLLGLNEPGACGEPAIKEAVTAELYDLRQTLDSVNSALVDSKSYLADLEGV